MLEIFRKYSNLRPKNTKEVRFFLGFRNGKCFSQPIGINTMGDFPKIIAKFLELPHPEEFTGHCFRRSSASLLADAGTSVRKRHEGHGTHGKEAVLLRDTWRIRWRTRRR
jgi:integrase